jgi:hypothetical protein
MKKAPARTGASIEWIEIVGMIMNLSAQAKPELEAEAECFLGPRLLR